MRRWSAAILLMLFGTALVFVALQPFWLSSSGPGEADPRARFNLQGRFPSDVSGSLLFVRRCVDPTDPTRPEAWEPPDQPREECQSRLWWTYAREMAHYGLPPGVALSPSAAVIGIGAALASLLAALGAWIAAGLVLSDREPPRPLVLGTMLASLGSAGAGFAFVVAAVPEAVSPGLAELLPVLEPGIGRWLHVACSGLLVLAFGALPRARSVGGAPRGA